jgi:hypothetical protein
MEATIEAPTRTDNGAGLRPYIEKLRSAADAVEDLPSGSVRQRVDWAYQVVTEWATPSANPVDREVARLTEELKWLRVQIAERRIIPGTQARALRRVLYGLYALMRTRLVDEAAPSASAESWPTPDRAGVAIDEFGPVVPGD